MPALILPVSGPYVGLWDSFPLGTQNDDGFVLNCRVAGQEVNESDAYGMTLVEAIYRGQNWTLRLRGLEWNKTGLLSALQMFGQVAGALPALTLNPILGPIGDRWSKYCQALLLTAILANPPTTPQTLTASQAGLAPNSDVEFMFTSKVREMPLAFVLLPYVYSNSPTVIVPFSTT